ncbi:HIT family protein [Ramlibacter alkalitolerans]|uniref:HIT family protein n=1 Tax=Ramlibacter alkalitolerans TaxID=2039631 RepID=A0ABS1JW65_9BURK|nr:HIT family protein [Ramlibacter alkalitolerans]MBL0428508.1 HIT family protein [Ramlibacter alkalitolerans]
MANATELKFGDPGGRLAQTDCWTLLLRPKQPTLGSMVLVCREPVQALGDVSERAFVELRGLTHAVEAALREVVGYQRINYLVLMMVDRDVHFHILPRYEDGRSFEGVDFPDTGWPGPPALEPAVALDAQTAAALGSKLREALARFAG